MSNIIHIDKTKLTDVSNITINGKLKYKIENKRKKEKKLSIDELQQLQFISTKKENYIPETVNDVEGLEYIG